MNHSIGDEVTITEEFVCNDQEGVFPGLGEPSADRPGYRQTTIRVGDTGVIVGDDDDVFQVRMKTGDYAGIVTDVLESGVE